MGTTRILAGPEFSYHRIEPRLAFVNGLQQCTICHRQPAISLEYRSKYLDDRALVHFAYPKGGGLTIVITGA